MKSYTATALGIAFQIWSIAVIINTIGDTFLFRDTGSFIVGAMLLITLLGGLFSAPVFLILWGILYNTIKTGKTTNHILKILLITGIGFAVAAWAVFAVIFHLFDEEMMYVAAIAPISGAIAICACYPNIKRACIARDENKICFENSDIEQTTPV